MQKSLKSIFFAFLLTSTNLFAQDKETIRVGVFLDMSGETSSFGIASFNGINMAVKEINDTGGINGRKLEVFLEDDLGRPLEAKDKARKLITERKVHVLIGEVASSNSLAAAPEAQQAKIPMITPSSVNPKVTQIGDYIFRACFVDPKQGGAMGKFAYNHLKLRRVALLSDADSYYGRWLADDFRNVFRALGGEISSDQKYSQVDDDFKEQLRRIRETKPKALYVPVYYGEASIIAKQARELGMKIPLLGGDGWDSPELWRLAGIALRDSYITNHFAVDNTSWEVKDFVSKYKLAYRSEPDTLAALGYDAVYLLADALKRSHSLDGPVLRDALAATTNFHGITGPILRFDNLRNPFKPVIVLKLDPKTSTFGTTPQFSHSLFVGSAQSLAVLFGAEGADAV